eukprot:1161187-Pelagomonas_calceolata.AAC.15
MRAGSLEDGECAGGKLAAVAPFLNAGMEAKPMTVQPLRAPSFRAAKWCPSMRACTKAPPTVCLNRHIQTTPPDLGGFNTPIANRSCVTHEILCHDRLIINAMTDSSCVVSVSQVSGYVQHPACSPRVNNILLPPRKILHPHAMHPAEMKNYRPCACSTQIHPVVANNFFHLLSYVFQFTRQGSLRVPYLKELQDSHLLPWAINQLPSPHQGPRSEAVAAVAAAAPSLGCCQCWACGCAPPPADAPHCRVCCSACYSESARSPCAEASVSEPGCSWGQLPPNAHSDVEKQGMRGAAAVCSCPVLLHQVQRKNGAVAASGGYLGRSAERGPGSAALPEEGWVESGTCGLK